MMATTPKDEKDPKRERVVMSKGHEVVGPGYMRLTGVAAKVTDRGENSGNPGQVNQDSNMDRQAYRVSRVRQNSSMDRRADRVSWVGNMEQ
jgi:hypothetical protein